ncbi:MAG: SIS domain-containing protein, partial [Thermococcus sp.]
MPMEFNMIRSIRETPQALDSALKALKEWNPPEKGFRRVILIGCGSSYFSSLAGNHILLKSSIESHTFPASEFMLHYRELAKGALVVASSRSGKTGEVIEAVKVAKNKGATIIGVTCNENSKIEEVSDETIAIPNGEEPNIPATKSFSAITLVLQGIALKLLGKDNGDELMAIKQAVERVLSREKEYRSIAEGLVSKNAFVHLGSGSGYVVALESALKFRETLGLPNEVFPALEFRHGPVALLRGPEKPQPIVIAPEGSSADALKRLVND